MKAIILLCMIFCHILDDYTLQGVLANMKQRSWWKEIAPEPLYAYDYIVALLMHSFSWSFMIMLPIGVHLLVNGMLLADNVVTYISLLLINMIVHGVVDHLKANRKAINLIQDQSCHMVQIFLTWLILLII